MNNTADERNIELQRLSTNYFEPAKSLLSQENNRNGNLCAAALLLLCLIDRLSQIEVNSENAKETTFKTFWQKNFPITSQKTICGKYELYPVGTSAERASEIVYALFRSSLVHNGASLKRHLPSNDCDWAKKLGDWFDRHDEFEIVNRSGDNHKDAPVFCLNTEKDKKEQIEITLDVDKILKKMKEIFVNLDSNQKTQTMVVTSSAARTPNFL